MINTFDRMVYLLGTSVQIYLCCPYRNRNTLGTSVPSDLCCSRNICNTVVYVKLACVFMFRNQLSIACACSNHSLMRLEHVFPHVSRVAGCCASDGLGRHSSEAVYDFENAAGSWPHIGVDDDVPYADQCNNVVW